MGVSGDDGSVLVSVVESRSFGLLGEGVWDLPPMNGYGGRGMMGFASFSSVHDEKRGFVFPFESPSRGSIFLSVGLARWLGRLVMMAEYGVAQAKGVNQRVGFHGSQALLVENY